MQWMTLRDAIVYPRVGHSADLRPSRPDFMPYRLAIVTPVLDDWTSLAELTRRISRLFPAAGEITVDIVAVDDGSGDPGPEAMLAAEGAGCLGSVEILQLALNLGHQRAIAIGLVEIAGRRCHDAIIVMDSDGEDRPEDIPALLAAARETPGRIIVARRAERSESLGFRLGYAAYKLLFRALTGRRIGFGNFCLIPLETASRLVHMPESWNHLAAAIMRSRIAATEIATRRGTRYDGHSRMNLTGLVIHGLSAISVYIDVIFVRMLLVAGSLAALTVLGIIAVVATRLLTPLAIPGWATTATGALFSILMQTVILVVVMTLVVLSSRSSSPIVPIMDCGKYVRARRRLLLGAVPPP